MAELAVIHHAPPRTGAGERAQEHLDDLVGSSVQALTSDFRSEVERRGPTVLEVCDLVHEPPRFGEEPVRDGLEFDGGFVVDAGLPELAVKQGALGGYGSHDPLHSQPTAERTTAARVDGASGAGSP